MLNFLIPVAVRLLTVSLSEVATAEVTVDYATADDTATAGSDYETKSGTVTIPTGSSSGQITINIIDDNTQEPDELFNVQLSNPSSNAAIADDIGLVAITDNDSSTSPIISDFGGNGSGAEQSDALLYLGVALNNDNLINSFADSANALAPGTVVNSLAEIKAGVNDNISELDLGGNGIGGEQSDALLYLGVTLNNDNLINSFADSANALAPGTVVNSLSQIKAFFEA